MASANKAGRLNELDRTVREEPDNLSALKERIGLLREMGRHEEAVNDAVKLNAMLDADLKSSISEIELKLRDYPDAPIYKMIRKELLDERDRTGSASGRDQQNSRLAELTASLKSNPSDTASQADMAALVVRLGKHEETLKAIDDAIARDGTATPLHWITKGLILTELRRYDDAVATYRSFNEVWRFDAQTEGYVLVKHSKDGAAAGAKV